MIDPGKYSLWQQIEEALEDIRPHLAVDGGDVEIVEVTEDLVVQVRWLGSCESCTMSATTLKAGVEETIKARIPQIRAVEAINGVHA